MTSTPQALPPNKNQNCLYAWTVRLTLVYMNKLRTSRLSGLPVLICSRFQLCLEASCSQIYFFKHRWAVSEAARKVTWDFYDKAFCWDTESRTVFCSITIFGLDGTVDTRNMKDLTFGGVWSACRIVVSIFLAARDHFRLKRRTFWANCWVYGRNICKNPTLDLVWSGMSLIYLRKSIGPRLTPAGHQMVLLFCPI